MSRPTAADLIAALQKEVAVFDPRLDTQEKALPKHEQALDPHDLTALRERLGKCESLVDRLEKERDNGSKFKHSAALLVVGGVISLICQLLIPSVIK